MYAILSEAHMIKLIGQVLYILRLPSRRPEEWPQRRGLGVDHASRTGRLRAWGMVWAGGLGTAHRRIWSRCS